MKKIGKIGKINIEARKKIADMCESENLNYCELNISIACFKTAYLAPAHRHKRIWYRKCPEKLHDRKQWLIACINCHDKIEVDKKLTEEVFLKLRGKE